MINKYIFIPTLLIVIFTFSLNSIAQEKSISDSAEKQPDEKSYGLVSTNYNSNIVFLGRKSSSVAPYLSAFAGYYHQSGLFINGGASYLTASGEKRIDLLTATTGYDFYLKNFSGGISGTKYFFNNKSTTVKSELSGNVSAYMDYDFDLVDLYIEGSTYFSNTADFIAGAGVRHTFYAVSDNLTITPTVYLNAGTQNYYSDYSNNIRFGGSMMNGSNSQSMGTSMTVAGTFKVLDYELSVPVSYNLKKLGVAITPVYAFPVSPATITNDQNTYKENLSNSFFWSLGLNYKFL